MDSKKPQTDPNPITLVWLKGRLDTIDRANAAALAGISDLKNQNVLILAQLAKLVPDQNVSPALETAILKNAFLGRSIDRKVPDLKA